MCYEFLPLTKEMVPALSKLEKLCFSVPWTESMFLGELENAYASYQVILFEGSPVAYMGLWQVADEGHITNVAVHPDHRKKGLAQRLIAYFCEYAKTHGLCLLTLEVRERNEDAIRLYEKAGFVPVGRRARYYEGKEDALLYTWFVKQAAEGENLF